MIDQRLLKIDVQSFCDAYSYEQAVEYDKKIERALEYTVADNNTEYNTLFLQEIYQCFQAMRADQMVVCHGKGCQACDYYEKSMTIISQFRSAI